MCLDDTFVIGSGQTTVDRRELKIVQVLQIRDRLCCNEIVAALVYTTLVFTIRVVERADERAGLDLF